MGLLLRVSWGIVDQALVSLTGAVLTVQGAATLPAADFGALATVLAAYYLAMAFMRGMVAEVYVLRFAAETCMPCPIQAGRAQASCVLIALAASATLTVVAFGGTDTGIVTAMAVALPFLLAQDLRRAILVSSAQTRRSAASSGVVLFGQVTGGIVLHLTHRDSAPALLLVWAGAAATSILLVRIPTRWTGVLAGARQWLRESRTYWPPMLTEALTLSGASQLPIIIVAFVAGSAVVGGLRAATLLLAPMFMLYQAVGQLIVAEATRVGRLGLTRFLVGCQALFLTAWALWLLLIVLCPEWILARFVGASLPGALAALPGMAVFGAAHMLATAPAAVLRVTGGLRRSVSVRLLLAPVLVGMPLLLAAVGLSTGGVAAGFGAYGLCALVVWNLVVRRALRRSPVAASTGQVAAEGLRSAS